MVIHCKAEFKKTLFNSAERASSATYTLFYHENAQNILYLKIQL